MKSKLLKLKKASRKDFIFALLYAINVGAFALYAVELDFRCVSQSACLLAIIVCWDFERRQFEKHKMMTSSIELKNKELSKVNKSLVDDKNKDSILIKNLITENRELKVKLKNSKMELARKTKKN